MNSQETVPQTIQSPWSIPQPNPWSRAFARHPDPGCGRFLPVTSFRPPRLLPLPPTTCHPRPPPGGLRGRRLAGRRAEILSVGHWRPSRSVRCGVTSPPASVGRSVRSPPFGSWGVSTWTRSHALFHPLQRSTIVVGKYVGTGMVKTRGL